MMTLKRMHKKSDLLSGKLETSKHTKRPRSESESSSGESDEPNVPQLVDVGAPQKVTSKWKNRERVLVFCSRGSSFRVRHLMNDFKRLMPHSRGESKLDKQTRLPVINEIAEMANCTKCLYFENRKQKDLYLWISNIVDGPSVKFLVHNVHTMDELRMSGNCLKASRPIMSFDGNFEAQPHLNLIKHLIAQTFATPDHHPRSQPFIDHVFSFSLTPDNKIWFRNFQIVDESLQLQEIGPRMVLELVRIFEGSFEGAVLYDNPDYVGPNVLRRQMKKLTADKYSIKQDVKKGQKERRAAIDAVPLPDPVGEVFDTERKVNDPEAKQLQRTIERKRRKVKKKKNMQNKSADMST
ncbi:Ribosome biogenesis protein BRX1 -like protein [Toxocara canis]|uniref:Ribosome biogenesis protein BRX1 homolog n=1 Tax=Toxocara canis TaxID=6265 RepID=A0A0B2VDN6_TOXCA|nr:Ribosome biogenesis protein BRX1 -like protein [Toxocara canis]